MTDSYDTTIDAPVIGLALSATIFLVALLALVFFAVAPTGPYALMLATISAVLAPLSLLIDLSNIGISTTPGIVVLIVDVAIMGVLGYELYQTST
jgi:hypothetical protein